MLVHRLFKQVLKYIERELSEKGTGTTFAAITKDVLQNQRIVLAPLNEQRRIVSRIEELFSHLDEGEAALQRVQKLLASYRRAVLKAAVTGELTKAWREANQHRLESGEALLQRILVERKVKWEAANPNKKYKPPAPPDPSKLAPLPKGWCWATIEQLAEHRLGKMLDKVKNKGELRPYLRNINVRWFCFDLSDIQMMRIQDSEVESVSVRYGDLVMCEGGEPGRAAVWEHPTESFIIQKALHRIRVRNGISPWYVNYCLAADAATGRLESYFIGTTIKHFTGISLRGYTVPVPSYEEQEEIVQRLQELLSRIQILETWCKTESIRSSTLRQSILKAAFSGQLVPQDPADEPASVLLERIQTARQSSSPSKPPKRKAKKTQPNAQPSLWEPS